MRKKSKSTSNCYVKILGYSDDKIDYNGAVGAAITGALDASFSQQNQTLLAGPLTAVYHLFLYVYVVCVYYIVLGMLYQLMIAVLRWKVRFVRKCYLAGRRDPRNHNVKLWKKMIVNDSFHISLILMLLHIWAGNQFSRPYPLINWSLEYIA